MAEIFFQNLLTARVDVLQFGLSTGFFTKKGLFMLVLTLRQKSYIKLTHEDGTTVIVRFLGYNGRYPRLGFEAPPSVTILRDDAHDTSPKKRE